MMLKPNCPRNPRCCCECRRHGGRREYPSLSTKKESCCRSADCTIVAGSSEIEPSSSQSLNFVWALSASGFQVTKGNIFKEGSLSEGDQLLESLLTPDDENFLRGISHRTRSFEATNKLLQVLITFTSTLPFMLTLILKPPFLRQCSLVLLYLLRCSYCIPTKIASGLDHEATT